ncbi:uncharacterized protein LOC131955228 [Physella acuta]|uniref:uncharacterized protein LOC131955228 n=1 Tax=Physella acuta TaxID=109671 RepID=UPI0027DC24CF|nr:uncharacterized protein LOC131955228 [Physella acuta]
MDHSSLTGYYKTPRVAGFLVKNELKYMAKVFNNPKRKFLVIVGGKISKEKVFTMLDLMKEVDDIIVAGEIASIFLKFDLGMASSNSKYDNSIEEMVKAIITLAPYYKCNLHYPVDLWIAEPGGENPSLHSITKPIPEGKEIVDVGDLSATMFARIVKKSNIILWTGTLGVTKIDAFAKGTKVLLDAIKEISNDPEKEVISIVCGRSCSEFINSYNPTYEGITHLSTAGTAVMKLLTNRKLFALDALTCKPSKKLPNFMTADINSEFTDQRVLVKADLNLPLDRLKDPFPLKQLIPLIKFLQRKGARVITLIGHVGNPSGRRESYFSLAPVKTALEEVLDQPVTFVSDGVADNTDVIIRSQEPGRVVLLENIRFHPEEEGIRDGPPGSKLTINISHEALNDFRNKLSSLGDVFINESFGTLYESNTSVVGLKHKQKLAGPTLKKEVTRYMELKNNMELPLLAIYGGEPTVDYMLRIYDSLDVVNEVILCGDLALAFYKVDESIKLGKTPVNVNTLKYVPKIVKKARANGITLHLPVDFVIAEQLTKEPAPIIPGQEEPQEPADLLPETEVVIVSQGIPKTHQVFDIGPSSIMNFAQVISHAKTIIYVGNAGYYEHEPFMAGTKALFSAIQAATNSGVPTVALGMETGVCIGQMNAVDVFSSYSTSLATFLHILLNKPLPGLSVLTPATEKKLKRLRIDQIELRGKRVLIRLDLFVPTVDGVVLDSDKLEDAVPTIRLALKMGAKCVVLLGHRGEPNGYRNQYLTLAPLIEEFNQILELKVSFIDRPCSTKAKSILAEPTQGSVFLMENLKFYPAEYGRDAEPPAQHHSQEPTSEGIAADRTVSGSRMKPDSKASDDDLTAGDDTIHSISDGDGGRSIDAIMFQYMSIKSVQQYKEEIAACGDVFINDDVTDVEETLTSLEGFGLAERAVGLQMIQYLQDSDDSVYDLPGLVNLSPAPVG